MYESFFEYELFAIAFNSLEIFGQWRSGLDIVGELGGFYSHY